MSPAMAGLGAVGRLFRRTGDMRDSNDDSAPQQAAHPSNRRAARTAITYAMTAVLATFIAGQRLAVWGEDLSVPYRYGGDALVEAAHIKAMVDHGWFTSNPSLGMPTGMVLRDHPVFHTLTYLCIKPASLLIPDAAALTNLYFMATFALTAIAALFTLRGWGVSTAPAVTGSVLFSLLPYHLIRGPSHLGLSAYYAVPLAVAIARWTWDSGRPRPSGRHWHRLSSLRRGRAVALVWMVPVIALSHIYYVVFSSYVVAVAGMSSFLHRRKAVPLVFAVSIVAAILGIAVVSNAGCILYSRSHGPNSAPLFRRVEHSLAFGLEIASLVIPPAGYGIPVVERMRARHLDAHGGQWNEARFTYIGAVAVIGVIVLLGRLLAVGDRGWRGERLRRLAVITLALLLLSTVGGFGYLASLIVAPQIRCYNRASVYIAFLGITSFLLVAQGTRRWLLRGRIGAYAWVGLWCVLLAAGVRDQTTETWKPEYDRVRRQYQLDGAFVRHMERLVPPGAMVAQLPHVPFLGPPPPGNMTSHDSIRWYLHSRSIRWSHGAVIGRPANQWLSEVTNQEPAVSVQRLCAAGFSGILVDRFGYDDYGLRLVEELERVVHQPGIASEDGRSVFFTLDAFCDELKARVGDEAWRIMEAREAVVLSWRKGFVPEETGSRTGWCLGSAELWAHNISPKAVQCELAMTLQSCGADTMEVNIDGSLSSSTLKVPATPATMVVVLNVPPGDHRIRVMSHPRGVQRGESRRRLRIAGLAIASARWHADGDGVSPWAR